MYLSILLIAAARILPLTAIQPDAAPPVPAPLRPLQFGQINFLHTTDTHGWHAGHLLESSYSADWGDYIDFSTNIRAKVEAQGQDLLVIDTGDRIEGNGLYDASSPRGKYTFPVFTNQHIDLVCIGNHELYKSISAQDELNITVPAYTDSYIASNLDVIDPSTGTFVPLAQRYKKFVTPKQGITILALGFIYDFDRNSPNTIVRPIHDVVNEPWFLTAVADTSIHLFVVIGHIALRQGEMDTIYEAIRAVQPHTPIQFFGGHFHIRDYRIFDSRAHALASGRFCETVGFQSISGLNSSTRPSPADAVDQSTSKDPTFFRRYVNSNLFSFYRHTRQGPATFHTPMGLNTTRLITASRRALALDETYGCSPQNYWMDRVPYPHPDSIFSLLTEKVFPTFINKARQKKDRLIITNTGAIRFDIFRGPFTRDSTYIVSPFTSRVMYIADVPQKIAKRLLPILNQQEDILNVQEVERFMAEAKLRYEELAAPEQRSLMTRPSTANAPSNQAPMQLSSQLQNAFEETIDEGLYWPSKDRKLKMTPGYTTHDDLGDDGDDTLHTPIDLFRNPNCVQTWISHGTHQHERQDDDEGLAANQDVDLVFNEFLQPYILIILNLLGHKLGERSNYTNADVLDYLPGQTFTTALVTFVANEWGGNC